MDRLIFALPALFLWMVPASAQTGCGTLSGCPPASTPLNGSELLYMVQNGVSKQITSSNFMGQNILPLNNTWPGSNVFNGATSWPGSGFITFTAPPYNADPTGTNPSDGAFSAWIAALASSGATGIVPPGTYKFQSPALFDTSGAQTTGIKVIGSGCNVTKFQYTGVSSPAFRVGQDKAVQSIQLSEITTGSGYVDGTYTNVPLTGGSGTGAKATISVQNTAMASQTITSAGSGYVNGTYTNVPFYRITGVGGNATATVIVSGGIITSVTIAGNNGISYSVGDTVGLVTTYLGGSGSGYVGTVTAVTPGVASMAITNVGTGYMVGDVVSASNTNLGGSGSGFAVTVRGDNFYTRISGINFISNNNGPTLQWGRNDMLDAINGPYSGDNCENNSNPGAAATALTVNSVITTGYFGNIADGPAYNTGFAACDFRGLALANVYGSCSNAAIGMHLTSTNVQYEYGNVFHAIDAEVTSKVLVIDASGGVGGSVSQNTWEGGQWNGNTCLIDATAGYRNEINNGNLGSLNDYCSNHIQGIITLGATGNAYTRAAFYDFNIIPNSPYIHMPDAGPSQSSGIQFLTNTSNIATISEDTSGNVYSLCQVAGCSETIKTNGGGIYGYNGSALLFAFSNVGVLTLYNSGAATQYYTDSSGNGALVVNTAGKSYYRTLTGAGGIYVDQINGATTTIESSTALYPPNTMTLGQVSQPWDISYTRKYNLVAAAPPAATVCGTSPIVAATSNNQGGYVTFGTGGATTACTVTFANAYPNSALCTVSWNSPPGALTLWMPNISNTGFTVNTSTDASGKSFSYTCTGN